MRRPILVVSWEKHWLREDQVPVVVEDETLQLGAAGWAPWPTMKLQVIWAVNLEEVVVVHATDEFL